MLPTKYDVQGLLAKSSFEEVIKSVRKFSSRERIVLNDAIKFGDVYFGVASFNTGWINSGHTNTWKPENFTIPVSEGNAAVCMFKSDTTWFLQLAKNTGVTEQTIVKVNDLNKITEIIKAYWKKGLDITNMCSDGENTFMICTKGLNLTQSYYISKDIPTDFIKKQVKEGQILIDILQLESSYLWLFSANTAFNEMHFVIDPGFDKVVEIKDKIITKEGYNNYSLSFIRLINGKLLFVFHK